MPCFLLKSILKDFVRLFAADWLIIPRHFSIISIYLTQIPGNRESIYCQLGNRYSIVLFLSNNRTAPPFCCDSWEGTSAPAAEDQEIFVLAILTFYWSKPMLEPPTLQVFLHNMKYNRTEKSIPTLEKPIIAVQKLNGNSQKRT